MKPHELDISDPSHLEASLGQYHLCNGRGHSEKVYRGSTFKVDERCERLAVQMVCSRPKLRSALLLHRESVNRDGVVLSYEHSYMDTVVLM